MRNTTTIDKAITEARIRSHRNRFTEGEAFVFELGDEYIVCGRYDFPGSVAEASYVGKWTGGNCWTSGPGFRPEMAKAVAVDPR